MSPLASAFRTSVSGTCAARSTRSSYGLAAASACSEAPPDISRPVESAVDDVHLLLTRQPDEVDGATRDTNGQAWILLRVLHGVEQHVAVQHVDVHVEARAAEVSVEDAGQIVDAIALDAPQPFGHERRGQRDTVLRVAIRNFRHRRGARVDAMFVATMHRVGARCERLAEPPAVGRVTGRLPVDDV